MIKRKLFSLLSLFLIIALVLSVQLPSFAANKSEKQLLVDIGIMKPYSRSFFAKDYNREDFAKALVLISNKGIAVRCAKDLATDISDCVNREYINFVIENNMMSVDTQGRFNPYGGVSLSEVIKGVLSVLGYAALAEKNGGTELDYSAVAYQIGVLKSVKINDNKKLTQEEVAEILANMLSIEPIVLSDKYTVKDYPVLLETMGLKKCRGKLLANSSIGLEIPKSNDNYLNIDGNLYLTTLDVPDYLVGANVTFYIDEKSYDEPTVVSLTEDKCRFVTINADEIDDILFEDGYIRLKYNDTEYADISYLSHFWVNKKSVSVTKELFDVFESGTIKLVSFSGSAIFDHIHMTLEKTAVISAVDYNNYRLITKHFNEILDFQDCYSDIEIYLNDKKTDFFAIKEDQVVSVSCDAFDIKYGKLTFDYKKAEAVCLHISDKKVVGTVDYISDEGIICINDLEYSISGYYNRLVSGANPVKSPVDLSNNYSMLLNYHNQIVDYEISKETDAFKYGYIIKAHYDSRELSCKLYIKLITEQGAIKVLEVADRIIFNGENINKINSTVINGTELNKSQIIRYRLINGNIKAINTCAEELELTDAYYINSCFHQRATVTDATVIFVDHSQPDEVGEDWDYEVIDKSALKSKRYNAKFFDVNDFNEADCVLINDATVGAFHYTKNCYMVGNINSSVNKNGDRGYTLTLYGKGIKETVFGAEGSIRVYKAEVASDITLSEITGTSLINILNKGDIIRYETDSLGEISAIELIYDFDKGKEMSAVPYRQGQPKWNLTVGNLYKSSNSVLAFNFLNEDSQSAITPEDTYVVSPGNELGAIPVFDIETERITLIDNFALLPSYANGNKSKIIVRFGYQEFYDAFVFSY